MDRKNESELCGRGESSEGSGDGEEESEGGHFFRFLQTSILTKSDS